MPRLFSRCGVDSAPAPQRQRGAAQLFCRPRAGKAFSWLEEVFGIRATQRIFACLLVSRCGTAGVRVSVSQPFRVYQHAPRRTERAVTSHR